MPRLIAVHMPPKPTDTESVGSTHTEFVEMADYVSESIHDFVPDGPVKIMDCFIPVNFVVLDLDVSKETLLILGRPFLSTAGAQINVGAGEIRFNINGKEEKFLFQPKIEQCSMIKIKYGPNPQCITEVVLTPRKQDNLVDITKEIIKDGKNEVERTPRVETHSSIPLQDQPSTPRNKKGGSSSRHSPEPTLTPRMMDYEQDEQAEPMQEHAAESQAEDMEINDEDAPYLDLWDDL
ncbi:uncharacterized protein LOC120688957 [Panicum virgatum]|uniref:uncharacterized protein LOC120688957 n=1 Tax=Panicum virgatum TaxID=38727 RepID=UPI0019D62099|nr:uncharacterized protein LOC120688957 [Panicum virgatum]